MRRLGDDASFAAMARRCACGGANASGQRRGRRRSRPAIPALPPEAPRVRSDWATPRTSREDQVGIRGRNPQGPRTPVTAAPSRSPHATMQSSSFESGNPPSLTSPCAHPLSPRQVGRRALTSCMTILRARLIHVMRAVIVVAEQCLSQPRRHPKECFQGTLSLPRGDGTTQRGVSRLLCPSRPPMKPA